MYKMVTFKHKGKFSKSKEFFERMLQPLSLSRLDHYGKKGVDALRALTPKDDGSTAASWGYDIIRTEEYDKLVFTSHGDFTKDGTPVVILLQYGHLTKGGTYVQGRDFINPAVQPVFDELSEEIRKEMSR